MVIAAGYVMKFPDNLCIPIVNHVTGRAYELVRADDVNGDASNVRRIASICNESDVYEWLFRSRLAGHPYLEENAREWLQRSKAEWSSGMHFVFVVVDDEKLVAAACDIKSWEPVAEIGYWASQQHRGVMTNAVKAVCALAGVVGYRMLFARTKDKNVRSQAVLERVGFGREPCREKGYQRFELLLNGTSCHTDGTKPARPH